MEVTQAFLFDHANIQETNFGQPPDYHLMQGEKATIPLKIYNDAVAVSAYDLADDAFGLIANRVSDLGKRAALHPKDLAVDILENGDTSTDYVIYDGQQFFSNTHTKPNSVNIDNLMAGTLDTTNYQAVRTAMRRFASDLGTDDVYGIAPTHTIVPPDLEVTINQIVHNSLLPVATWNTENAVLKGSSIPIVEPRLTDVNDWYVATTELGVMPFIEIRHNTFGNFDLISETSDSDPSFRDHHQRRWWIQPKEGCFRVVSYTYKGKGRNRQKIETVADIKKSDKTLPGDPDSKEKQKTLLECYKAKANDKNSKVIKVIE
jgi:hypothetical protein